MNEEAMEEDERHIEITIGDPVAEQVVDSCVGTDNRRYYKVKWQATWEPEEDLLAKYQNLIEDYWKVTVAAQNDMEHKNLINNLLENITSQQQEQQNKRPNDDDEDKGNQENKPEAIKNNKQGNENEEITEEMLSFYKEVNSPEHKISDEPLTISDSSKKPPPLVPKKETEEPLPFSCDDCGRTYSTSRKLKDHKRKLHTNQGLYQCSECPKQFPTKRALQMHMNRHTGIGPNQCHGCGKRYMTPQELQFHKRSCNHLVEKEFPCEQCGKRFATKTHLVFHMKIHLPDDEKPFKCQFCTRTFAYNHDCVHHMRLHLGEKPFKCSECDKAYHRKSYLTEHMFIHTGISKYQCETCQGFFKTQQMLQTHVKNIHILKKDPSEKPKSATKSNKDSEKSNSSKRMKKKKYKCDECDKEFKYVKEYHYHQIINHKESIGKQGNDKEEVLSNFEPTMYYKCKKCDKTFKWMSVLKKHAESHNKAANKVGKEKEGEGGDEEDREQEEKQEEGKQVDVELVEDSAMSEPADENDQESVMKADDVEVKEVTIAEGDTVMEGAGDEPITVCYVSHKGESLENGEELNILACGHCLAGFTDEGELNQHVLTEHADLILQQGIVATTEEVCSVEESGGHHVLEGNEGMKIIQLALEAKQVEAALQQQQQMES